MLLLFYGVFYFIDNRAWIRELDTKIQTPVIPTIPLTGGSVSNLQDTIGTDTIPSKNNNVIPDQTRSDSKPTNYKKYIIPKQSQPQQYIEINTAEPDDWQSLYNIGPYRADKIVNFRQALGGFYSIDQVGETYALPDSVFREIKPHLQLQTTWQKISINQMIYDSLYLHPYITKQMAYFIVKYRENKNPIDNQEELMEIIEEKDHERLKKLEPYLDFGIN